MADLTVPMWIFTDRDTPYMDIHDFIEYMNTIYGTSMDHNWKLTPVLGMNKVKTGEECNLVIFKGTPMNNHMNGKLLTRPFHWYACSWAYLQK